MHSLTASSAPAEIADTEISAKSESFEFHPIDTNKTGVFTDFPTIILPIANDTEENCLLQIIKYNQMEEKMCVLFENVIMIFVYIKISTAYFH